MKRLTVVSLLALAPAIAFAAPHPFNAHDLVMMDRVSDPHLTPDGSHVAFSVRSTDYAANKGVTSVWMLDLGKAGAKPVRITDPKSNASGGRFSPDGGTLYFLAAKNGVTQLWSVPVAGGKP
ncbi:MAG TPA: S9 family peptidase, partial [Rhodanobacteraceae bacterium]